MARKTYPPEYRRRMVEMVRTGRSPESLAREFEPVANTIRSWARQADIDEGKAEGTTSREREEYRRLLRENKRLSMENDILKKAAAWFARESVSLPPRGSRS